MPGGRSKRGGLDAGEAVVLTVGAPRWPTLLRGLLALYLTKFSTQPPCESNADFPLALCIRQPLPRGAPILTHALLKSAEDRRTVALTPTALEALEGYRERQERTGTKSRRADLRTADLISLRVINRALQGVAQECNSRISKPISVLCLALCCAVLRSRWCQSSVRSPRITRRQFLCARCAGNAW